MTRAPRILGECVYCGAPATCRDHVLPKSRGGTDDPGNLVLACHPCNESKSNRTPDEWLEGVAIAPGRRSVIRNGSRRSIYVEDSLWNTLEVIAKQRDDSVAKLARQAVKLWIASHVRPTELRP